VTLARPDAGCACRSLQACRSAAALARPEAAAQKPTMGTAKRFYDAFAVGDWYTMGLLYAPNATFSDPAFPLLSAEETALMWKMLLTRARDFKLSARVKEDDQRARIQWVARYTFGKTGRRVVNRINTDMTLSAGRIVRQVDSFDFWRWSRQALGMPGLLLGWTPYLKGKVQQEAAANLARFAQREATSTMRRQR
jgi:ketosteroid isomerase-like protein